MFQHHSGSDYPASLNASGDHEATGQKEGVFPFGDDFGSLRGIDDLMAPLPQGPGRLPGDFYYDDHDDVVRGVSMAGMPSQPSSLFGKDVFSGGALDEHPSGLSFDMMPTSVAPFAQGTHETFGPGDVPPNQPSDEHFQFEATTVVLKAKHPHVLGNAVLEFLETQVVSSIRKLRRSKYAVQADVFLDAVTFCAKIRIWTIAAKSTSDGEEYAVEFRRSSGDMFKFADVYRQLCSFLAAHFPEIRGVAAEARAGFLPPPSPLESGHLEEASVAPLLDMAGMDMSPNLQTEAASALSRLAREDSHAAKLLCSANAFDVFAELLTVDAVSTAWPTAKLLSVLMTYKEAGQCVAEHSILQVMIQKIMSSSLDRNVLLQLTKAVSLGVRCCAPLLPVASTQELQGLLQNAVQVLSEDSAKGALTSQALSTLHDTLLELEQ